MEIDFSLLSIPINQATKDLCDDLSWMGLQGTKQYDEEIGLNSNEDDRLKFTWEANRTSTSFTNSTGSFYPTGVKNCP
jgi:hypothetical protein